MDLAGLEGKLGRGERLTAEDALFLYEKAPLEWLRERADAARKARHGDEAYYNRNIHFEPTNLCVYACKFCAFYRPPKSTEAEGAWDYGFGDVESKLARYPVGTLTEIHVTGGVHPDRGVEYGEALCAFVKSIRPEL